MISLQPEKKIGDVCVVVPFYNRSRFATRLLNSIKTQTLKPKSIYIVDNGSSFEEIAKCHDIIKSITWGETEVILVSTIKAGNANYARNLGMDLARTRYVAFLDSDDWWENNHLENSIRTLLNTNKAGIYCGAIIHKYEKKINDSIDVNKLPSPLSLFFSRKKYIAQTSSYIIDMNIVKGRVKWDESLKRHQDYDFFISLFYNTPGWAYASPPTTNVDWQEGGAKKSIDFRSMVRFLKKWIDFFSRSEFDYYISQQIISCRTNDAHPIYTKYYKAMLLRHSKNKIYCSLKMSETYLGVRRWAVIAAKKILYSKSRI